MRLHARLLTDDRSDTLRAGRSGRSRRQGSTFLDALVAATLVAATLVTAALVAATLVAAPLTAQEVRVLTRPDADRRVIVRTREMMDDRPMIGVTTAAESERGDTLGLRIESVQRGSPAEKAGLKAGDRVQAANSVSLRADRADAGEEDYSGVLNRRLQREVQRTPAGASIDLRVLTAGQPRTVKVTPVKASDLPTGERRGFSWTGENPDRAMLGVTVASTGSARDTLGLFVQSVVRGGRSRTVRVTTGKASDLPELRLARPLRVGYFEQ